MVVNFGMSKLGPVDLSYDPESSFVKSVSEKTSEEIDAIVLDIVERQLERAKKLLSDNRDKLDLIASELLLRETIDGDDIYAIVKGSFTPTNREEWLAKQQAKARELERMKKEDEERERAEALESENSTEMKGQPQGA